MPEQSSTFPSFDRALASRLDARTWYVAYSGGLDSTVLLHLARAWCRSHSGAPELVAWHVNHALQKEADAWQAHCAAVCESWGIRFRPECVSPEQSGKGVEAAARDARYAVFEAGLDDGDTLFMAHHLDDQVETFLLRLLRGAGLRGMSGIPAERDLGKGILQRPLLDVERARLEAYAGKHALRYITDPSNRDTSLDRNFLRHEVLPLIEQRWRAYRQTVSRATEHMASTLATLENNLPEPVTVYSTFGDPGVPLQVLTSGARDVAVIRLRSWLHARELPMPDRAVINEFLRQLHESDAASSPRLDCGSYALQRYGDAVYLAPQAWRGGPRRGCKLAGGGSCSIPGVGTLRLIPAPAEGVALAEGQMLEIEWRSGGERCRPQGRAHSQTLKKLLQEKSVPPWWRERIPLLSFEGELLAVGDLWLCESSRLRQPEDSDLPLWQLHWEKNTFSRAD